MTSQEYTLAVEPSAASAKIPDVFALVCIANGYQAPKVLPDGRWTAVMPLIFTGAIIIMRAEIAHLSYEDRWCYKSTKSAAEALAKWGGIGEPEGWHRHPTTGRRRPEGDPLAEYINH